MEAAAGARARRAAGFSPSRFDARALSAWVLALAIILYLAFNNGGYAFSTQAQVGIAVWWVVTICAAWGLFPRVRPSRSATAVILLLAAFTAWTALGITWSISSGRSFQNLALIMCYLGILALGVCIYRERSVSMRHTLGAVGTAVVIVALMALAARLWPHLEPGSQGEAWGGARISWPVGYWNGLAALMAIGLPALLSTATTGRTLIGRALAAAAIPILLVCAALTQSRGGIGEVAVALIVFLLFSRDRFEKLLTCAVVAAGSAALIYAAFSRADIKNALETASNQHHQAMTFALIVVLVCLGVGIVQAGLTLALRHASLPRIFTPSVRTTRTLSGAAIVVLVAAAIAAHVPHRIDHAWHDFKTVTTTDSSGSHFGATSGEGRYQFWVAGIDSAKTHPLTGSGPGTFQLDWLPRAHFYQYIVDAHNLYVQTYTELGIPGLLLIVAFFAAALVMLIQKLIYSDPDDRTRFAAVIAAFMAFLVGACYDWLWHIPVIPACLLLMLGASLARHPDRRRVTETTTSKRYLPHWQAQVTVVSVGLCALAAIAYPLATNDAVTASQHADSLGQLGDALQSAKTAVSLESGSATAQRQLALIYDALHDYKSGIQAAKHAVSDEPQGWENWYVLFGLYTKAGNVRQAIYAYKQIERTNPTAPFLRQS